MTDLYLSAALMFLLSAAAGAAAYRLSTRLRRPLALSLVAVLVAGLLIFSLLLWDDVRLARLLPIRSAMIVGNPQPLVVALIIGLAWRTMPGRWWRKSLTLVPLAGAALFFADAPLIRAVPALGPDRWIRGVCRQTSAASCSPAAAATLLVAHGISASEAEMARLCLTSTSGTSDLGLYRGLRRKTDDTPWRVEAFHGSLDDLRRHLPTAVLLNVGLRRGQKADPRFATRWGWTEGVPHTVVLYRFLPNGQALIGDPAVGREQWDALAMETLWHGDGFRLVRR